MADGVPEECSIKEFKNTINAQMYKKEIMLRLNTLWYR